MAYYSIWALTGEMKQQKVPMFVAMAASNLLFHMSGVTETALL